MWSRGDISMYYSNLGKFRMLDMTWRVIDNVVVLNLSRDMIDIEERGELVCTFQITVLVSMSSFTYCW